MSRTERLLRLLLRAEAVLLLCALPAAVMPTAWMDTVARAAGLAPVPRAPLVEYLPRLDPDGASAAVAVELIAAALCGPRKDAQVLADAVD